MTGPGLERNPKYAVLSDDELVTATLWASARKEAARPDYDLILERDIELTSLQFEMAIRGVNAQRVGWPSDELINAAAITDLLA